MLRVRRIGGGHPRRRQHPQHTRQRLRHRAIVVGVRVDGYGEQLRVIVFAAERSRQGDPARDRAARARAAHDQHGRLARRRARPVAVAAPAHFDLTNELLRQVIGAQHLAREPDRELLVHRHRVGVVEIHLRHERQAGLAPGGGIVARWGGRHDQERIGRCQRRVALAAGAGSAGGCEHGRRDRALKPTRCPPAASAAPHCAVAACAPQYMCRSRVNASKSTGL